MAGTFKFELVSPERVMVSEDAEQVVLPGADGDFTVLPGHAPVVALLRPGMLDVRLPSGVKRIFVKGGFAEVDPSRLTVLAERAFDAGSEGAGDAAAAELKSAEAELAAAGDDELRYMAQEAISSLKSIAR